MIGQYGSFDKQKYERDFRNGFFGIEAGLFERHEDTLQLIHESRAKGFQIGVHFPLRAGMHHSRDALFLALDEHMRKDAYEHVRHQLSYVSEVSPSYILFHYPKPVLLDDRVNWEKWRFADSSEFIYENQYSFAEFTRQSEQLFAWLAEQGRKFEFAPVLEFDALNRYIYETDFLERLLVQYPEIRLCLDTGRLFTQEQFDPFFDAKQVMTKYAKYSAMIHLSNVQIINGKVERHHYPVLPELNSEEGWAPIEHYIQIIKKENPHVRVMFEHQSNLISDDDLDRCYAWVDQLFKP
ncbi:MAG: hypothetical protein A2189_04260 [Paenibacillus sp. RIFOXYA1_FULL_44_5]|nr:MAG: hypothetical protein A2189_04260 [Paenibacillus sp. RIFOXYA1_FULL_44_5]